MSNTQNTATVFTFTYAMEACTRCGGSGSYSRCEMYGTDCFKCVLGGGRRGLQLTEEAAASRIALNVFKDALLAVNVADLKIGDMINATSNRAGQARRGKPCKLTIKSISEVRIAGLGGSGHVACAWLEANAARSQEEKIAMLEASPVEGVHVSRYVMIEGEKTTIQASASGSLLRISTAADVAQIVAFARTLPGLTLTEK